MSSTKRTLAYTSTFNRTLIRQNESIEETVSETHNLSVHLPKEVLTNIFSFYIITEGVNKLLKNVCHVSQIWRDAAMDFSLWRIVDDSITKSDLLKLCQDGQLSRTKEVKFSSRLGFDLHLEELQLFAKNCSNLTAFDLCHCIHASFAFVRMLPIYFPNLVKVHINASVQNETIVDLLKSHGKQFVHLHLSYCSQKIGFWVGHISEYCPNLRELRIEHISMMMAHHMVKLQRGCSLLRQLYMSTSSVSSTMDLDISEEQQKLAPGFPDLEILDYRITNHYFPLFTEYLALTLKVSTKLKSLDLRYRGFVPVATILNIPAANLECIHLKVWSVCDMDLVRIQSKWKHSLKYVNAV